MTAVFHRFQNAAAAATLFAALLCAGCGTPGAPLPPSLKLPDPVTNLTAVRTGNQVALAWTMPKKNTDKLLIKDEIPVRVCRKEASGACQPVPANLTFAPNAKATFTDTLPADLASGNPRPLSYFVELLSPHGRSAGPSNAAHVVAGQAPAAVAGLVAQLRKDGAVLSWTPDPAADQPFTAIRIDRKLLQAPPRPAANSTAQQGPLASPKEPLDQTLLVDQPTQSGHALDKTILFNRIYEYRAQRIARITIDGQAFELDGPYSAPIQVKAVDTFPPAVPTGLAAVATAADSSAGASIDLSWLPVPEADLAGYAVYRQDLTSQDAAWQRVSPAQLTIGPGFHDPNVQPGHTYRYAASAIDQLGHESARSQPAEETVPNP